MEAVILPDVLLLVYSQSGVFPMQVPLPWSAVLIPQGQSYPPEQSSSKIWVENLLPSLKDWLE